MPRIPHSPQRLPDAAHPAAENAHVPMPEAFPASHRHDEYPFYTERQLRRRDARHPTGPLPESLAALSEQARRYLDDSALEAWRAALALPPLEQAILDLRLDGKTVREIAAATGLKKWRVEKAMERIRHRFLAVHRLGGEPPDAWQHAYLAETERRGRR